jgi:RimJ/RimL family protein N-acetyltransferase
VVFGTLVTRPEFRSRGYSTAAKSQAMCYLYDKGFTRFYSDTSPANIASQRTSEKLGFQKVAVNDIPSEPD